MTKPGGIFYPTGQQLKLSRAVALLGRGETSTAAELLADICAEPSVEGVTDDALFRLSILRLGSGREISKIEQTQNDLKRLVKEYPSSPWSTLASGLMEFIASTNETQQQNKTQNELNFSLNKENKELKDLNHSLTKEQKDLKDSNYSLSKENAELRGIIEKMKSLELELGKMNKPRDR